MMRRRQLSIPAVPLILINGEPIVSIGLSKYERYGWFDRIGPKTIYTMPAVQC